MFHYTGSCMIKCKHKPYGSIQERNVIYTCLLYYDSELTDEEQIGVSKVRQRVKGTADRTYSICKRLDLRIQTVNLCMYLLVQQNQSLICRGNEVKELIRFLTLVGFLNTVTEFRLYVEDNGMTSKILNSESCLCRFAFL